VTDSSTSTARPLRWGILSTARINDEVIPAFEKLSNASLDAVASRNKDRAESYAREKGIPKSYGSYEDLLADEDIDCVYISLPNSLHAFWAESALNAGKHVLCEKPLAPTAPEAAHLFEIAKSNDRLLMEAFMYRHHPQTALVKDLIVQGSIGRLQVIRMSFNFKTSDPASDIRYSAELAGGALLDVGSYCVSFSTFVMDSSPIETKGLARIASSGVEEGFVGEMAFDDNVIAVFDCSLYTPLDIGLTAVGEDGVLHVPTPWYPHKPPQQIRIETESGTETIDCPGENAYLLEIDNVCRAVLGEGELTVSAAETMRNLETLDRLAGSAGLRSN
jgi:D-xylose 1-dehydrogenase (NADP+, D-xylono-1,5-lactone-forming)